MKTGINRFAIGISCILAGLATQLSAQEKAQGSVKLQLGLAVSSSTSLYQGVDSKQLVFPLVIAEYKRFYFKATNFGYRLFQAQGGVGIALEIGPTFDGYKASDSSFLSGMAERKAAWEAALVFEAYAAGGKLKGKLMRDISNKNEGNSASLEYERVFWKDQAHLLSWSIGGEFWDHTKTNYYYGVATTEARLNRAAYSAPDAQFLFVGAKAFKRISPEITLIVNAKYSLASDAIADSPLVTDEDQWSAYAGFIYQY